MDKALRKQGQRSYETSPTTYGILKLIITVLMHIMYRYRVTRLAPFPESGATIVVVNHLHLLDPGVVAPIVPRMITTLAAAKWQKHWLARLFLRAAGVIFVRRGEVDRKALRSCLEVLRGGGVLAIAPEGTRSVVGSLQRAKSGVAYLAARTNAAIVPIAYSGVEKLADWKRFRRPTCHVVIGKPFHLPKLDAKKLTREKLQEFTDLVMIQIGLLLPESYRGIYSERIAAVELGS